LSLSLSEQTCANPTACTWDSESSRAAVPWSGFVSDTIRTNTAKQANLNRDNETEYA